MKTTSRGIRNNNPLNIRIGNTWLGEVPNPTDSDFEQFVSVTYGLRASFCILRRYIRRYRRNTLRLIINAWAPKVENDTERYIKNVSQLSKLEPDEVIDYSNKEKMFALVKAMAQQESGAKLSDDILDKAYSMA